MRSGKRDGGRIEEKEKKEEDDYHAVESGGGRVAALRSYRSSCGDGEETEGKRNPTDCPPMERNETEHARRRGRQFTRDVPYTR